MLNNEAGVTQIGRALGFFESRENFLLGCTRGWRPRETAEREHGQTRTAVHMADHKGTAGERSWSAFK